MAINVRETLFRHGIHANKRYGQNFLADGNVVAKVAESSCAEHDGLVVEIGAGLGSLTVELAKRAGRVLSYEVDERLRPILAETLNGFDNAEVLFEDAMKADFGAAAAERGFSRYTVAANLPYYITTPLLFKMLESAAPPASLTVMVQREVADRMTAAPSTSDYGVLTVAVNYYGEPSKVANVPPNCFVPRPDVGSAVVRIAVRPRNERVCGEDDEKMFFAVVKAAFQTRRKTLTNCLSSYFNIDKSAAADMLQHCGISEMARGEQLGVAAFSAIARTLLEKGIEKGYNNGI